MYTFSLSLPCPVCTPYLFLTLSRLPIYPLPCAHSPPVPSTLPAYLSSADFQPIYPVSCPQFSLPIVCPAYPLPCLHSPSISLAPSYTPCLPFPALSSSLSFPCPVYNSAYLSSALSTLTIYIPCSVLHSLPTFPLPCLPAYLSPVLSTNQPTCCVSCLSSTPPPPNELRMQKFKSHLMKTQSLNVLPLKPGEGQYIAINATLTARDFFLISTLPVHSPAFFPKPLLISPVLAVADTWFLCGPSG